MAGFLGAYGFVSFWLFMALEENWTKAAPSDPNTALGLVYSHNEHGSYTYYSAFQATSLAIMFQTSIPLFFVALLIMPKSNLRTKGWSATWEPDDPRHLFWKAAILGVFATPLIVLIAGPYLIRTLNANGFVLDLG